MKRVGMILALAVAAGAACQRVPRPLIAGSDACDFCRMTISDVRFGAELQLTTGKLYTFDAIECLASFHLAQEPQGNVRAAWVTDFESGRFVPVDSAVFLAGGSLHSPMGRGLVAFAPGAIESASRRYGGEALAWNEVLALMKRERLSADAVGHDADHATGSPGR